MQIFRLIDKIRLFVDGKMYAIIDYSTCCNDSIKNLLQEEVCWDFYEITY